MMMYRELTSYQKAETHMAKIAFIFFSAIATLIIAVVMYFVILYKGYGLSVQSWPWMIFLWVIAGIVGGVKDFIVKCIKKI